MKKIAIFSYGYDEKIKIIIAVCVIIAVITITFAFYTICIKKGSNMDNSNNFNDFIQNVTEIENYNAEYVIKINSGKTLNEYNVVENADIVNNIYDFLIDNSFKIEISKDNINLKYENIGYEYLISNNDLYDNFNFLSFSNIIKLITKINNKEIQGNIKKIDKDGNISYEITTSNEVIDKINKIAIELDGGNNIKNIFAYDSNESILYSISFKIFTVKK